MKNHHFSAGRLNRGLALVAVTLALVASAADLGVAQQSGSGGQRDAAAQAHQDAQRPPQPRMPWWKDPAVIKEINLTPDQAAKIDAIWRKRETDMQAVATESKKQQDELERLVSERKVGPDVIGLQFDRVEAQRTILNKSRAIALYKTSLILSAEQNKALKAIGERNRRERR